MGYSSAQKVKLSVYSAAQSAYSQALSAHEGTLTANWVL
jgi:hypothetical protein